MSNNLDASVLIPTYNRCEGLRETLEAMTRVDQDGLSVEFVVIDNNSSDDTKQVVESFAGRLPIRYLFQPRPGKNCALNMALDEIPLGEIVVFTDDDVTPCEGWLMAFTGVARRWPDSDVFGGAIRIIWPDGDPPGWAAIPGMSRMGYGDTRLPDSEQPYPPGPQHWPSGNNFCVRRSVLSDGQRFGEGVGPIAGVERRGTEVSFLLPLKDRGHGFVYCPEAVIGHRLQRSLLTKRGIRRKAWANGAQFPRIRGLCRPELHDQHPLLWTGFRLGALAWALMRYARAELSLSPDWRIARSLDPINDISYNMESLRVAWRLWRKSKPECKRAVSD